MRFLDKTDVMKIKGFHLGVFFDLLLIYAISAAPADTEVQSASGSMSICDVSIGDDDVDVDTVMLTECQENWKGVLTSYVRAMRNNREFDICGQYAELRECLVMYVSLCRQYGGDTNEEWMVVMNQLEPICTNRSKNHVMAHECFEDEMRGSLAARCDEYHKFNVQQRTRHECHFLREAIHCRVSLVSSGCGSLAGKFALDLLKVIHRRLAKKLRCRIPNEHNFKTFQYSDDCGRGFLQEIENCSERHLTKITVAEFHSENDLVSTETETDFRSMCRAYRKFMSCVEPINKTCSDGIEKFLEFEGSLRRYMLKMDHICDDQVINVYASSLHCYQSLMSSGHLGQCNVHWSNLRPWLSNITAYQFFCDSSHINTVNLLLEIQKSHMCHKIVFESECGQNASKIMADLMDRALRDPLYLRLGFRPDCQLHAAAATDLPSLSHATSSPSFEDESYDGNDDEDVFVSTASTIMPLVQVTRQTRAPYDYPLGHHTRHRPPYATTPFRATGPPKTSSAPSFSQLPLVLTITTQSLLYLLLSSRNLCSAIHFL